MHWNDWPLMCWVLSTLLCLLGRRWRDAIASACFALFMIFDTVLPTAVPWQLKWAFAVAGVTLVLSQVAKEYIAYQKKLAAR